MSEIEGHNWREKIEKEKGDSHVKGGVKILSNDRKTKELVAYFNKKSRKFCGGKVETKTTEPNKLCSFEEKIICTAAIVHSTTSESREERGPLDLDLKLVGGKL